MIPRLLALDVGTRRTGTAFFDPKTDIIVPLDTIVHENEETLALRIAALVHERSIEAVVLGLPLLLSGDEGSQARIVRELGSMLIKNNMHVAYVDERYTTQKGGENDGDARAACAILTIYCEQNGYLTN
jgi:putative Holliday junction resolvase